MKEKELIDRYFHHHIGEDVIVGVGDDGAVLKISENHQLVVSTDSMVQGRHFLNSTPPYFIGYKLMAVNISDMAAMCAMPKWITLNLTLPFIDESWLKDFSQGFNDCAKQLNISLIGGDLTSGAELNVSAQILGVIPKDQAILRSEAQADDLLFVTGKIGSAGKALEYLLENNYDHQVLSDELLKSLYQPTSRVMIALDLQKYITSMIDISDGLLHEAELLCQSSQLGAQIDFESIPIIESHDPLKAIVAGDDYELLFTANIKYKSEIEEIAQRHSCSITQIGKMKQRLDKVELLKRGKIITKPNITGFEHFA
ncbi:MAG: thiamine-phosphate kinase [Pseudomonadota bacterium]